MKISNTTYPLYPVTQMCLIGRIHGAIVVATVGAIVVATIA